MVLATGPSIAYYRVSTQQQGRSGLGLEAQRKAVLDHLGHAPDVEFTEIESGKRQTNRPELQKALNHAELTHGTLIVAKLDRLSRNAAFLMTLTQSKVHKIVFADMPEANRVMIGMMALLAEWEAEQISIRTKAALAAAKARGTVLGGSRPGAGRKALTGSLIASEGRSRAAEERRLKLQPYLDAARAHGHSTVRSIAGYLNGHGVLTARGKPWTAGTVHRLLTV